MTDKIEQYYKKVKCPYCYWSEVSGADVVCMSPCYNCNSTGYIYEPVERIEPRPDENRLASMVEQCYDSKARYERSTNEEYDFDNMLNDIIARITPIKDKECQERIKDIFKEVE